MNTLFKHKHTNINNSWALIDRWYSWLSKREMGDDKFGNTNLVNIADVSFVNY